MGYENLKSFGSWSSVWQYHVLWIRWILQINVLHRKKKKRTKQILNPIDCSVQRVPLSIQHKWCMFTFITHVKSSGYWSPNRLMIVNFIYLISFILFIPTSFGYFGNFWSHFFPLGCTENFNRLFGIYSAALFFILTLKDHTATWQLNNNLKTIDSKLILNSRIQFNRQVFICVLLMFHMKINRVCISSKAMHENINC